MRTSTTTRIAFLTALALGTGCAITDYQLVTDNDQVSNGRGSGIVNTSGKAMILDCWGAATVWPDGTDQLFTMVDQKANGDRTLTTYNNFSTMDEPTFYYSQYCNPDWQGCAIVTAPDPESDDDDPFDYRRNPNCFGARSLSFAYATNRYYGECGRARIALRDRLALLNMGTIATRFGNEGLLYELDRTSLTLVVDDGAGLRRMLEMRGRAEVFVVGAQPRVVIDARHPLLGALGTEYADFLREHRGRSTRLTVTYNGIAKEFRLGPPRDGTDAEQVQAVVRRRY